MTAELSNTEQAMTAAKAPESSAVCYSIIVPAFNEEQFLPATLSAIHFAMSQCDASGEVLVVDNNSSDRTAEIARAHGATVVFEAHNQIARARNAGAREAHGRYLIFVDADTLISATLLAATLAALATNRICGGGATLATERAQPIAQRTLKVWNSVSALTRYAAGCYVYCRSDAFREIGGFSEAVYASEEIWLSRRLKTWGAQHGQEFKILPETVITSARKLDWLSGPQLVGQLLILLLFPFAVRSRRLCGVWYRRPGDKHNKAPPAY